MVGHKPATHKLEEEIKWDQINTRYITDLSICIIENLLYGQYLQLRISTNGNIYNGKHLQWEIFTMENI